jgi:hypothetical protein
MSYIEQAARAWKLFEIIAQLESLLWETYNDYFMDMAINDPRYCRKLTEEDDFPF